jgi:glyoxylase-like metal-dependent hydrolase (beta-lactamase superfamily II)/rhodanese-related sulfurtransferase
MKLEQIYTGCLAQGAYYIESEGQAAIIDPLREIRPYVQKAEKNGAAIRYVFETHFHADFVSGHLDLAKEAHAPIIYGPNANPTFDAHIATDGEVFPLGNITITALHTPGHTMESTCYLLKDEAGIPKALFSGDTLFIGDVGRPDLAQQSGEMTKEQLAGNLFDSLRNKIMALPDAIIVYPAHGAGSDCGKNMSKETSDTLGHQKKTNYALRADMTRDEFIREVTHGLSAPPAYFPLNVLLNRTGYESMDTVMERGQHALAPDEFEAAANGTGAMIIDTRDAAIFAAGFIPGSINIGIDGNFAPWVGAMIPDISQPLLLITDEGREEEVITRLARVGFDHILGYLKGGFHAWVGSGKETDHILCLSPEELVGILSPDTRILDVRKPDEFISGRLARADNMPLDCINEKMPLLDKNATYYVHCAGGYRSMLFISTLRARGFYDLVDIKGGFKAIKDSGRFSPDEYVFPPALV